MATFNEMNRKIRERSFVDGDNNTRGPQRGFRSIRNLTLNLRQTALLPTDGVEPETLSRLSEIGIAKQERYPEDFEELQREIFNKLQQVISQGDARFQPGMAFRNSTKF